MKKITLLLVAAMCAVAANVRAIDFTLTSADQITKDGVTITFDQSNGSSAPAWFDNGLRLYANNTITITATEDISEVVFNWEVQGSKAFATASADNGSYSHPETAGEGTWTNGGSAIKTIVFTVGASGQLQLNTLSVTLSNGGSIVTPDPETGKEVSVTFTSGTDKTTTAEEKTLAKNGVTLTATSFNKASYYQTFKNETFTVSADEGYITSIVITCTANGTTKYGPGCYTLTSTEGEYSYESSGKSGTWEGKAQKVSLKASTAQVRMTKIEVTYIKPATTTPAITCSDIVDFGTILTTTENSKELIVEGENLTENITATVAENSNFSVEGTLTTDGGTLYITLTATEAGTYTETLLLSANGVSKEVALKAVLVVGTGNGTKEKPFTVEDVTAIGSTLTAAWVKGYIVGCVSNDGIVTDTESADYKNSNLALGSDKEGTLYLAVQLPNNDARAALNLVDNTDNLGKEVLLYGTLETYFLHAGLKNVSEYEFTSAVPSAISNTTVEQKAVKMIENGQLVIIREGVKYNAQGAVIE